MPILIRLEIHALMKACNAGSAHYGGSWEGVEARCTVAIGRGIATRGRGVSTESGYAPSDGGCRIPGRGEEALTSTIHMAKIEALVPLTYNKTRPMDF